MSLRFVDECGAVSRGSPSDVNVQTAATEFSSRIRSRPRMIFTFGRTKKMPNCSQTNQVGSSVRCDSMFER